MSKQTNLVNTINATFSLESEDGHSPCASPDGQTKGRSGPVPVRANRSAAQEKMTAFSTRGTCGPLFEGLSPSAILQSSLANKLRANLGENGSPECAVTWKEWDMPSGAPICALRASARRTSDSVFIGWPTPRAEDSEQTGAHRGHPDTLNSASKLSGWTTPSATDGERSGIITENMTGTSLTQNAKMAGWATPTVQDAKNNAGPSQHKGRRNSNPLNVEATMAQWPTPNAMEGGQTSRSGQRKDEPLMGGLVSGLTPSGSNAPTASSAGLVLNPRFSLWLQGFPVEWACCGALAMQSSRNSRRSSSKPATK